jgi:hypothetical protein
MLAAVWMVTDGRPLADGVLFETNASEGQARALLTEAGVPKEAAPGLPHLTTVNADSPDTASVTTTGVEPAIPPGPEAAPPAARLSWGTLYPNVCLFAHCDTEPTSKSACEGRPRSASARSASL